ESNVRPLERSALAFPQQPQDPPVLGAPAKLYGRVKPVVILRHAMFGAERFPVRSFYQRVKHGLIHARRPVLERLVVKVVELHEIAVAPWRAPFARVPRLR